MTVIKKHLTSPQLFVAASNASARDISRADYVCDGVNDDVEILAALAALPSSSGVVEMSSGQFNVGAEINIAASYKTLQGQGQATTIFVQNNANLRSAVAITGTSTVYSKLKSFTINGNKANQTNGDGVYISGPTDQYSGIYLEDIYITSCKNNGLEMPANPGTSSIHFVRVHSRNNDGNGFYFAYNSGVALTDAVFIACIAETNALNGFYLAVLDSHFFGCKAYYNGSAGGNNHGWTIAGYNNFFTNCESQDNYQSGFYSENAGDPTYGAQYCTFVNCTGNNNGQNGGVTYAVGLQAKNVTGWQIIGGIYNTHPYPSFTQRIGVSLEGTTTGTYTIGINGTGTQVHFTQILHQEQIIPLPIMELQQIDLMQE
jgi:hypothetical protein